MAGLVSDRGFAPSSLLMMAGGESRPQQPHHPSPASAASVDDRFKGPNRGKPERERKSFLIRREREEREREEHFSRLEIER